MQKILACAPPWKKIAGLSRARNRSSLHRIRRDGRLPNQDYDVSNIHNTDRIKSIQLISSQSAAVFRNNKHYICRSSACNDEGSRDNNEHINELLKSILA